MARMLPATAETAAATAPAQAGYTVLARRYRPQTFADLIGQEATARALTNALKNNRVAHAYLFTGSRGVGKTSTARILAKALNCIHGPTPTPCGVCDACRGIAAGEDVDVLEIDGASNNKVEEVRDLRSNVQYRPSRGRFKIYIIDEVHMLSVSAFNALLKTLEEPPPHVKFIFATTEVHKLPVTILSRCQRFDLNAIPQPLIKKHLAEIVREEGLQADDEALDLVARRANGSMRDGQSLLDQLLAFGGDRLTAEQVHQLLGTAGDDHVLALAAAVLSQDPKQALDQLDQAAAQGFQMGELLDQLMGYWRDLMVVHCAGQEAQGLSVANRHRPTLEQQVKGISLDTILAGLDVLSTTRARLARSNHARTLVEMALVRLGRLGDLVSVAQVAQWLQQTGPPAPRAGGNFTAPAGPRTAPPEGLKKKSLTAAFEQVRETVPVAPSAEDEVSQLWPRVLQEVGRFLATSLEKADIPAISGPNTLVLRFPAAYNHEKKMCATPTNISRIEDKLRSLTGKTWSVRLETTGEVPAPQVPTQPAKAARPRRNDREEAEKRPLVRRVKEVLGGQTLFTEEDFGLELEPTPPEGETGPSQPAEET
jgi:DNA polymerase-3 subunit gamma/tau